MEHISKISCKEKQRNEIKNTKREKKTANKENKVLKQTIDSFKKRNVLFWEEKKNSMRVSLNVTFLRIINKNLNENLWLSSGKII